MDSVAQGELLRAMRERKGVSVRQLAKMADVSATYVSQMENGKERYPYSKHTLMKMLIALSATREEAQEMFKDWITYHKSEIASIEQFVSDIREDRLPELPPLPGEEVKE